jgi:hypothetical protein
MYCNTTEETLPNSRLHPTAPCSTTWFQPAANWGLPIVRTSAST